MDQALGKLIWEQGDFQTLAIKLDLVWGFLQTIEDRRFYFCKTG